MRLTINRALIFAATCSVAVHGGFVLFSGGLITDAASPGIDRQGGKQASEVKQIAGTLVADISETKEKSEHLKPVETERPVVTESAVDKVKFDSEAEPPQNHLIDPPVLNAQMQTPIQHAEKSPTLDSSQDAVERLTKMEFTPLTTIQDILASSDLSPVGAVVVNAPNAPVNRIQSANPPAADQSPPLEITQPAIEPVSVKKTASHSQTPELLEIQQSVEKFVRTTVSLNEIIKQEAITVPNQGNANKTAISDASTGEDRFPRIASNQDPKYPSLLLAKGIGGVVRLRVVVNRNGMVDQLSVDQSSGYEAFDESAVRAVQAWKFHPAKREGKAVSMEVIVPIRFKAVK